MTTGFQQSAFQDDAFQIDGVAAPVALQQPGTSGSGGRRRREYEPEDFFKWVRRFRALKKPKRDESEKVLTEVILSAAEKAPDVVPDLSQEWAALIAERLLAEHRLATLKTMVRDNEAFFLRIKAEQEEMQDEEDLLMLLN